MVHHGATLKKQIERLGITQKVAAQQMGYATHQAFASMYRKPEFNEVQLEKILKNLGIGREIFFPKEVAPDLLTQLEQSCWKQLMNAQNKIIQLQQILIDQGLAHKMQNQEYQKPASI